MFQSWIRKLNFASEFLNVPTNVPNVPSVGQRSLINDITTGDDIIDLQDHLHDLRSSPISW
jgi:hypothetical protein